MANLAVDIGNTRMKWGLFEAEELVQTGIAEAAELENLLDRSNNQNLENLILCNVGKALAPALEERLKQNFYFLYLDAHTPLPFENAYQSPETLGKDRLAAIAGAYHIFPGRDVLVIDIGTAITFDFLSAEGRFEGGNISPGMDMRYHALYLFTARLPLVDTPYGENFWGSNTTSALQAGVVQGILFEIEGYIRWLEEKQPGFKIILTGGGADFFGKKLKSEIFVNHNLVLTGLNKILDHNVHLKR